MTKVTKIWNEIEHLTFPWSENLQGQQIVEKQICFPGGDRMFRPKLVVHDFNPPFVTIAGPCSRFPVNGTRVQGKHDCWTECSGPEFCLPFVKIVNRPSNKPWVSWKYLRIPSNVQGHTPGSRKYHNHRVWSKQSHILMAVQNLNICTKSKHCFNFDCLTKVKEGICPPRCSSIAKRAKVMQSQGKPIQQKPPRGL